MEQILAMEMARNSYIEISVPAVLLSRLCRIDEKRQDTPWTRDRS